MKRKWITFGRIVHAGTVNFIRNASLAMAAMAVMVVTLTIILFSFVVNATFANTIDQITSRIDISVYLKDETTEAQTDKLVSQLKDLENVESVRYLSKADALQRYLEQNAGNEDLVTAVNATDNPLPATVLIKPVNLDRIDEIKTFLSRDTVKELQSDEPSYSGDRKEAIDNISHATNILQRIGIVAVIIFTIISALIIFNTIQMAIFNRRDEIQIMRLLGASTWYIRGPFIVESIIYGMLTAVISVLIIHGAFAASAGTLQATSLGLLDINYALTYFSRNFLWFLTLQLAIGMIIGAASSAIATRRYLKFKTK